MGYADNRLEQIFKCIVESYVDTAEPVGSRTVSKIYAGHLSPASIRNVMADLEEMGYIEQPHTSAGRIPTAKGYRFYVDRFLNEDPERIERLALEEKIRRNRDLEDVAQSVSSVLAAMTHQAGLCVVQNLRHDNRLYVDGASQLFDQPEFHDLERIKLLVRALELKRDLLGFLQRDLDSDEPRIYIGSEIECQALPEVSIVVRRYTIQGQTAGCLGIIGPTRMRYDQAVRTVNQVAESISAFLSDL